MLFRRQDGSVAALEDACWHRLLPLSQGTLHDEIAATMAAAEAELGSALAR